MRNRVIILTIILLAVVLMCMGISSKNLIYSFTGIYFAWQIGRKSKLILSLDDCPDDCEIIEHWKIVSSLLLGLSTIAILMLAFYINSYFLGNLPIFLSFILGFNVRVSYKEIVD